MPSRRLTRQLHLFLKKEGPRFAPQTMRLLVKETMPVSVSKISSSMQIVRPPSLFVRLVQSLDRKPYQLALVVLYRRFAGRFPLAT